MKDLIKMNKIDMVFPGVRALDQVDFTLQKGEIHALMGENGAGKSTLIKALTGVYKASSGTIYLEGKRIDPKTPLEARQHKIATVYQEVNLCSNLSVAENIFIGHEDMSKALVSWKTMKRKAKELLAKMNIHIDVSKSLDSYSIAIAQMVAIARALSIDAKVLILDEPTASLDDDEVKELFKVMKKLREEGLGIIFVTHFLDQVYEVCDRVTVLRNGKLIGEYPIETLPKVQLVAKMIGKEIEEFHKKIAENKKAESFFEGVGIGKKGAVQPLDLHLNKGEVLGLGGLLGSGRTETARLVFGADQIDEGIIKIKGKKVQLKQPNHALQAGIGFCPEDRKVEGIIGDLSVRENIVLALQAKYGWAKYIPNHKKEAFAKEYIELLSIKTPHSSQAVKNLSGGNQQKVILARWLLIHPELLILDEPTRGIDVGTKIEIQKLIVKLAGEDMSILFISSELDEMLRCCDRMMVFRDHHVVGEIKGDDMTQDKVMEVIAGGGKL